MPFYEKGNVRIRYEEIGSGFPLLATPGGGLNSRVSNWPTAVFNSMEEFKNDFRVITMDQRNANAGESTGPIPVDKPWDAFADDQLGLMDHLGIDKFGFIGYCIGGPFGLKLIERAPNRVVACVCVQPVGARSEDPDVMYRHSLHNWAGEFRKNHPDVSEATIEKYLRTMWGAQPNFVHSVTMDFAKTIRTPILVLPDETPSHPYQTSVEIASLCPNAEFTVFPWRDPPDLKARTIDKARRFLKSHVPMKAAA
ncbi:MAG: alpha/beta hydrolase [Alphaproteobacteria bacterium]|nr:alpha/beta hydrolase [Alphaproteobacteria bacterium]